MKICSEHKGLYRVSSICPYCQIIELEAAMIDLAKHIPAVDITKLQLETNGVWCGVICDATTREGTQ